MISHYYFHYDESLESLLDRLNLNRLDSSLNANIEAENDIFLIHSIIRLNSNTGIYRKRQIKDYIWEIIKDKCVVDTEYPFSRKIENYKKGYETLFNYCWKQKFTFKKDSNNCKPVCKLVYEKMPIYKKILDNNISLAFSLVILLFCVYFIDKWLINDNSWMWQGYKIETHPIMATCIALWISTILVCGVAKKSNSLIFIPIITCLLFIVYAIISIFFEPSLNNAYQFYELSIEERGLLKIQFLKRDVCLGLACLLLIPIIAFNHERLEDHSK